jgi:hypothetical protein
MHGQTDIMRLAIGVPKEARKPARFAKCPSFHRKTLSEHVYSYGYFSRSKL